MKIKKYPTQEELKKDFDYKNGHLIRKRYFGSRAKKGDVAGSYDKYGYRRVCYRGMHFKIHRLIWIYFNGFIDPTLEIDHINGVKDDNRIENLRLVTSQQNKFNKKVKGYSWDKLVKKYKSSIVVDQQFIHLGYHSTEEDAHRAYLDAKEIYHII